MKMTRIKMIKTNGDMILGQSYNIEETKAYWMVQQGLAVDEAKPSGPSEIKPAEPSEIKTKKKLSRGRTARES